MKKYFDIWPMDDWTVQKVCQKYRTGEMVRPSDGSFYLRNLLNQALRERGINIRVS